MTDEKCLTIFSTKTFQNRIVENPSANFKYPIVMALGFFEQFWLLLKKDLLVQRRSPGKIISQFVLAIIVLLLLLLFDKTLVTQPSFTKKENIMDEDLPKCPEYMGDDCVDV